MGLSITVGVFFDPPESQPKFYSEMQRCLAAINKVLRAHGLPEHHEPESPKYIEQPDAFGYSGLHYLRRIAAHMALNGKLPAPGTNEPTDDPIVKRYYGESTGIWSLLRTSLLGVRFPSTAFEHLMMHSDAAGFYVPIKFERVLEPPDYPEGGAASSLGSSIALLAECEALARALSLPLDQPSFDAAEEAAESQGEGQGWHRYGIESLTCLQLVKVCKASIDLGAAIVFH